MAEITEATSIEELAVIISEALEISLLQTLDPLNVCRLRMDACA
jgi:hypothetical protein